MTNRLRIVILGAGFGGLRLAKQLASLARSGRAEVLLVSRDRHQLYTPSIYEIVGGYHPREICIPLDEALQETGVQFVEATVERLSLRTQIIHLTNQQSLTYDHLVIALGSVTNDFGIKGVREHAYPLKTLEDAWFLRQHIESEFAAAYQVKKPSARAKLTFVIAGGGPAGVELAGELAEYRHALARRYRVPLSYSQIELVEAAPEILGKATPRTIALVRRQLNRLGVTIKTRTPVKADRVRSIVLGDRTEHAETLIWAAGVKPHPLIGQTRGLETDRRGAVVVDSFLRADGHANVWVIGDAASVADSGVVTAAMRHADQVAQNVTAVIADQPLQPYQPHSSLLLMPIGHRYGVFEIGRVTLAGWWMPLLKRLVDLRYLIRILPPLIAFHVWRSRTRPCPDCHARLNELLWSTH